MFFMNKQEKVLTLYALTCLANELNIKDEELITTDKQNNKFNKILEENQGIFKDTDVLKQDIIEMVNKYINKLNDTKTNKKGV